MERGVGGGAGMERGIGACVFAPTLPVPCEAPTLPEGDEQTALARPQRAKRQPGAGAAKARQGYPSKNPLQAVEEGRQEITPG